MCEFHGKSLDDLINHKRKSHTMDASCSCTVCDFVAEVWVSLRNHMDVHTMYVSYTCDECDFHSSSNVDLRHLMATHRINFAYQCTQCYL